MDFSLIFPTLGDPVKVTRYLDSFERTTKRKDRIEVLIAIDEGEREIVKIVEARAYSFPILFYERPKTDNFSDDYYNWLANRSAGKNIWATNDDVRMVTDGWDDILRKKIAHHPNSYYLIDTKESTRGKVNKDFCCFPIISRKAVCEIGFFFYPQVRMYPADKVAYQLFSKVNSIIDAQEVELHSDYVSEDQNPRLWGIYQEDLKNGVLNVNISKEVIKLLLVINKELSEKAEGILNRIWKTIKEKVNGDK